MSSVFYMKWQRIQDLRIRFGRVALPDALPRKYPSRWIRKITGSSLFGSFYRRSFWIGYALDLPDFS
jgi:hypothetical protein